MSIIFESVPRERLTQAVESGPLHYRGIMRVVRDAGINLCIVPQHVGSFLPPRNRPSIVIIGDDLQTARGPSAFHGFSLRRYIKRCKAAAIVSSAPPPLAYDAIAVLAASGADVVLIETRPEHEADWHDCVKAANPDISIIIATVEPQGGVH
jgi:hypothetical protein